MARFRNPVAHFILAAIAVVLAAAAGLTATLGAHPFWDIKVALYAVLPAAGLWVGTRRWPGLSTFAAALMLIASALSAYFGKAAFAASFAENALAGRFWFLGWIGVCVALIWFLASVMSRLGR